MFDTCLIDGMTRADISESYTRADLGKKVAYYLDKFVHHLAVRHGTDMKTYCKTYLKIQWPICPVRGTEVGFGVDGRGVILSQFVKGGLSREHCPAFDESCKRMSEIRKGAGNPMHGKAAWNRGLTAETDSRLVAVSEFMKRREVSPESVAKGVATRTGMPSKTKGKRIHTDERREWFRGHTARLWARGVFSKVSSIHIKMREFLLSLPLTEAFEEEFTIGPFAVDFGFKVAKIAVEADGDYYHVNPEFYPNGPENAMQRRNFGRDHAKNQYLAKCGWTIMRAWEHHINDGSFKEPLICKLKASGLLGA